MAVPSENGDYVKIEAQVWWVPGQPDLIHLTSNDEDFHHPKTGPGLRVVFSSNPKSANYHPGNFNRCRDVLLKHGKSAPPASVEEGPRRLDKR